MSLVDAPAPPRSPWQLLYGAGHRARRRYWTQRARRLPRPVLSIGNLHWGGGGKTPLTAAVAGHLRDRGARVAILSRGYKSRGEGVRLVSHYDGVPLLGPGLAGDEPVLLAGLVPGAAVVVHPDRHRAGRHALERLDPMPDVFVLDDGFSHLPLERDLDLLVFPSSDPFAGGRLWPGGRLREPLASVARADAVLLTGPALPADGGQALARTLRRHGFEGHGFIAPTVTRRPEVAGDVTLTPTTPVLLVSAIARPEAFERSARDLGLEVVEHLRYADHHDYPARTLDAIRDTFHGCGARAVVTTGKDRVKLHGRLDLPLADVPLESRPEAAFFTWLAHRLDEFTA
ncbi:MAG: tetraacyldisaccharide 4'-kinase [Acidobacteriota bacterium]